MNNTQPPAEARIPLVEEIRLRTALRAQHPATEADGIAAADAMILLAVIDATLDLATQWTTLAPPDDWGQTPADTMVADAARQLLATAAEAATKAPQLAQCTYPRACPDGPSPHPRTAGCDRPWARFGPVT